ncbi:MAG: sialidase, partial [Acidobacteriota bacterium]
MRKLLLFVLLLGATQLPLLSLQESDSDPFAQLKYRHIGPQGNRVSAVVGVPGDPNLYYIGAASGGIFKSEDAGAHWKPVFDDQPVASIGSLAVAPSDPNVVWAGTGETFIRSNVSLGNGIYRSTDAGKSWEQMGLEKTGRIGRVVIHPTNPDVVYAAALGHCYGPQPERGVYRTQDGGTTWEKVLFVDEDTGAVDLVMDPNNPRILLAGMWQMQIRTWGRSSGGPGSGIHMSRDGGDSWEKLEGKGLPKPPWGKIGLAMTPRDSNRVYALIETNSNREFEELKEHQGVLWRSDDGGRRWRKVSSNHTLAQRPLYYTRAVAAPDDADEIHFMSTVHTRSLDGGKTVKRLRSGGDHHDMWIDPLRPDRMIVGHDQGISISVNRGKSWFRPQLPIAQMYHVYTDNQIPYFVYGNRQDGPSMRGPSNTLTRGSIPIGAWHPVGGCESGFAVPDPVDNHIVWSGCYEGILDRYDLRTGQVRNVSVWPDNPEGWAAADLKYRFQWTFPVAVSPHDHNRVYAGSQHVHQTTDGGRSWTVISGDLTTNDKDKQQKTGGLTPDDVSPT